MNQLVAALAFALATAPLLPAQETPVPPAARAVVEDDMQGIYLYETQHFRFDCPTRLDLATVSNMAQLFENTYSACCSLPLDFPCRHAATAKAPQQSKFGVCLFLSQPSFLKHVGPQYAGVPGVYMNGNILLPYACLGICVQEGERYSITPGSDIDTDTLIHEVAHQMTLRGITHDMPTWFGEGIAEYVRLAADAEGLFNFSRVKEALTPYIISGPRSRRLGREFTAPPLEQFMNLSRMEFNQARGKAGHFNYGFSTLLTWYFLHLDGAGDAAALTQWLQQLQTKPKATAHLRYELPENPTPEQIAAERRRLMQLVLATREQYYYEPLLAGRSWQELEADISRKVHEALGITIHFPPHP